MPPKAPKPSTPIADQTSKAPASSAAAEPLSPLDAVVDTVVRSLNIEALTPALADLLAERLGANLDMTQITDALWDQHGDDLQKQVVQAVVARFR